MTTTKVFVGNLTEDMRTKDLREAFEKYGCVAECDIIRDYAFVHFDEESDAKDAVRGLHNKIFQGTKIRVELSRSTVRHSAGMGDPEACFKCGEVGHFARDCPDNPNSRMGRHLRRSRSRSRSPPPLRSPRYYRDPIDPAYRYPPLDPLYARRAYPPPPPPPREYDDDPYTRPPPEYYKARLGQLREPYRDLDPYPYRAPLPPPPPPRSTDIDRPPLPADSIVPY